MGDDDTISRDDFATWYSPALTLGLLDTVNFESVARLVHPALASGDLRTTAETLTVEDAAAHLKRLPASLWVTWDARLDLRFWATANLIRQIHGQSTGISAYGVRFDPAGLARLFPGMAKRPESTEAPTPQAKGGRPAGKNGEPIARIAKRLIALTAGELVLYTAEAVASELISEYQRLNLQPPSPDNARRDAQGILRAVRN
ncbi:hypothetical protein G4G27_07700 [Sphingomonas sp. So64.6b]|uniref:hypothetical protein n=1 Tax=Sphingomonas sp. So64.6b TaxID=2997354 RepID=UPI001600ED32|nr:hypothetical protein [Sphingomonas sp. So64.6b]QNA83883.1 hypothetical protein G4G27_07700 [Sphingomonas sp. So64.6b]